MLLAHLQKSQNPNGSYESWKHVNKRDVLQSTTYALLAMLYLKESGLDIPQESIRRAITFIDSEKKIEQNQVSWTGGVFFSGGTIVRNILYFTSDAYTTALVAMAYQKYHKLYFSPN